MGHLSRSLLPMRERNEAAMHDRWIPTNPRPLDLAAVRALLQEAY